MEIEFDNDSFEGGEDDKQGEYTHVDVGGGMSEQVESV
jgi:hypothetical protein